MTRTDMTARNRVRAAIEGRRVDRLPVAVPYHGLFQRDLWQELSGQSPWRYTAWLYVSPEEHIKIFRRVCERAPFDICEPLSAPTREERDQVEFVRRTDGCFRHDKRTDTWKRIDDVALLPACILNETCHVFDRKDIDEQVAIVPASEAFETGIADFKAAAVKAFPETFIMTGGIVSTFYQCSHYLGMQNLLMMVREKTSLIEYLSQKILEKNIERIRLYAAAGGDGVYIDDAMTTNDVISLSDFERFSLPFVAEQVREVQRLGLKAILIYFGGIADRMEQICSTGADALLMETSMKNYRNDLAETAEKIHGRMALFGNLDPVDLIERGTDEQVKEKVAEQARIGRERCKGFIASTGSPITPDTPLERVQDFIRWAQEA